MLRLLPFLWSLLAAKIHTHINSDRGASAVEYGLLVALIAVVIIGAVTLLGENLDATFQNVADTIGGGEEGGGGGGG